MKSVAFLNSLCLNYIEGYYFYGRMRPGMGEG